MKLKMDEQRVKYLLSVDAELLSSKQKTHVITETQQILSDAYVFMQAGKVAIAGWLLALSYYLFTLLK